MVSSAVVYGCAHGFQRSALIAFWDGEADHADSLCPALSFPVIIVTFLTKLHVWTLSSTLVHEPESLLLIHPWLNILVLPILCKAVSDKSASSSRMKIGMALQFCRVSWVVQPIIYSFNCLQLFPFYGAPYAEQHCIVCVAWQPLDFMSWSSFCASCPERSVMCFGHWVTKNCTFVILMLHWLWIYALLQTELAELQIKQAKVRLFLA